MTRSFIIVGLTIAAASYVWADELQPNIPEAASQLVAQSKELRLNQHDIKAAEAILKDVVAKYPDYYKAHYNLGLVYQDKNDYDAAIHELEQAKAIREAQDLAEYSIYNTLGWVYMQKGDTKGAEGYYLTALHYESKNTPDSNTRLYNNLAWYYYNLGKPDEAKKYLDVAEQKYQSKSAGDLKKLVDQLAVDKQKIKVKVESYSGKRSQPK